VALSTYLLVRALQTKLSLLSFPAPFLHKPPPLSFPVLLPLLRLLRPHLTKNSPPASRR